MPVIFPALCVLAIGLMVAFWTFDRNFPERRDFVDWVDPRSALEIAKKSKCPVLYDFSAKWCSPCRAMEREVFGNREIARFINERFVPVKVLDSEKEEGSNSMEVSGLQKKYGIDGFPTLVVITPDQSERFVQSGYPGRTKTRKFLYRCISGAEDGASIIGVRWQALDDVISTWKSSGKPLLIMYWNERGSATRFSYLDPELSLLINSKFTPVEVAYPMTKESRSKLSPESLELIERLNVRIAPCLVVVPSDEMEPPHFQYGDNDYESNQAFLEQYLRFRKEPKR
ncbi:MAG: thioredoxin family protein [Candidatus Obscuribacterales bacterium]